MASMKLGSKSDVFHLDGQTWLCSTGLPSDVIVEIGNTSFHLHKFPLMSRSELLESMMKELVSDDEKSVLQLHDVPGGAKTFLLVAKFCYGIKMELTASNVVTLRCAADYLRMTEDYGEKNLIMQTENFLNHILGYWSDSIKALKKCEEVLPYAEELHIVSQCIHSLVLKACVDPILVNWPMSCQDVIQSQESTGMWNGITTTLNPKPLIVAEDWWFEEISSLTLPIYKRFVLGISARRMKPEKIAGSVVYYAKKHLPLLGTQSGLLNEKFVTCNSTHSIPSEADQRNLLEEIVELLPNEKRITPTKFLLRLLRTSMALNASKSCCAYLEKRIGFQLDEAALEDLLIPNTVYAVDTLYNIECVQRMLDHFMTVEQDAIVSTGNYMADQKQIVGGPQSVTPMTKVANLIDDYLAEVAPDVTLKLSKFQSLAAVIPDYARQFDDGIYRAIDIFLKAHPWLTESEKEQICSLMNCQKLSLEATTHAAQNERLPLRVIVQVVFFEQLKLRKSVADWLVSSENLESTRTDSGNLAFVKTNDAYTPQNSHVLAFGDMEERVIELEKECLSMKQELEKIVKAKVSWNIFLKKFGCRLITSKRWNPKISNPCNKIKVSPASASQMEEKAMIVIN